MWDFFEALATLTEEQRKQAMMDSGIWLNHRTFRDIVYNLPTPERLAAFRAEIEKLHNQA